MLRAVVVDDSPTVRSLLTEILSRDHEIEVVGLASDGVEAVEVVQRLRPDVVTMDIQMPRMNGFEATKEIMITAPTPIVIVTGSTLTREIETTMSALRAGALTVLVKPPGPESPDFDVAAQQLVTIVKAMAHVKLVRQHRRPARSRRAAVVPGESTGPLNIVAIAASTGGPQAIELLLSQLPRDFASPILVVQHISHGFTAGLAAWLSTTARLRVKVAEADEPLLSSTVYIAPEQLHLGVSERRTVVLSAEPPLGGFRPSATYLFESIARSCGDTAAVVVLTGMGQDGLDGLRAVRQAGGTVIAQDEASCVVFGMPGAAVREGLANHVLPLDRIALKLVDLAGRSA